MASAYGNDIPSIKLEGGSSSNGQGPVIKPEPDNSTSLPPSQHDDDIYEDTGDLDFSTADQSVYLTRLPNFLWEAWSKLDEDQEVQVGTLRIEGSENDVKRVGRRVFPSRNERADGDQMSMMLLPDIGKRKNVPKEYNLQITDQHTINTFIFSEKDLSGFKSRQKDWALNDTPVGRMGRVRKNRGRFPEYRRTIPKQTSISGQARTELNCQPVENAEYQRIMDERTREAFRNRKQTQLIDGVVAGGAGNILNPGALGSNVDFTSFINKVGPQRKNKNINKTARMPQNELLDLIYECFKEYTYWPLRSLKERVQQPEAYLRQTLEMVAIMLRSGPHAMQWQLKPESREGRYAEAGVFDQAKDEAAPEVGPSVGLDGADDMEEEDENVDMEDIPLE